MIVKMKLIAVYLCWLFMHIMFYVISLEHESYPEDVRPRFLPFGGFYNPRYHSFPDSLLEYLWYYDITELLVYTIVPLLLALLYIAFKPSKK